MSTHNPRGRGAASPKGEVERGRIPVERPLQKMFCPHILEISVESVDAALAAERGGAHRVELCSNAQEGGTTPASELLRAAREHVHLPIFTMIRPRSGEFLYSDTEFVAMQRDIDSAKKLQMDGIVLGLLNADGTIDIARTTQLVRHATPLPVTFHRAFDQCRDLSRSLEDVIKTGAARLLTSGGKRTAPEALEILANLVRLAGDRIAIMPGSGLHAGNIREAAQQTHASEYHAGLSSVIPHPAGNPRAFEQEVRKLATALGH
jgi:copper homeostasis protein